jgi:hypothetical protein
VVCVLCSQKDGGGWQRIKEGSFRSLTEQEEAGTYVTEAAEIRAKKLAPRVCQGCHRHTESLGTSSPIQGPWDTQFPSASPAAKALQTVLIESGAPGKGDPKASQFKTVGPQRRLSMGTAASSSSQSTTSALQPVSKAVHALPTQVVTPDPQSAPTASNPQEHCTETSPSQTFGRPSMTSDES